MVNIETIIGKVKKYNPGAGGLRIREAFEFAKKAHMGQVRKSGDPFIIHPLAVADALAEHGADEDTLIAALLHDVPEDTKYDIQAVENTFGKNVAFLVEGVTKVRKEVKKVAASKRKMDTLRKLFSSIAKDRRVMMIKLLDRWHNMQTINHLTPEKQHKIALETLDYYVPLAESVNLWEIRTDLANLCFRMIRPQQYAHYQKMLKNLEKEYRPFFSDISKYLNDALERAKLQAKVEIRLLTPYEMHELRQKDTEIKKHFFRVVVSTDSETNCYAVMGVIHKLWKPVLKYFNDFIAIPKENDYRALHTSVVGSNGRIVMILIKAKGRDNVFTNAGVSSRVYRDNLQKALGHFDSNDTSESYLKSVKKEVFCRHVNFFDDEGTSYKLPEGSSIIDFYYLLREKRRKVPSHSIVAIVNERKAPLKQIIQSDDVIKFAGGNHNHQITAFMLRYARTTIAKLGIKKTLAAIGKDEAVHMGKRIVEDELLRAGLPNFGKFVKSGLQTVLNSLHLGSVTELFEKAGRGTLDSRRVSYIFFTRYFMGKSGLPAHGRKHFIAMHITNDRNRVGFVKDILDTFQKLNISIQEIKGYSPRRGKLGIVDLKIHEKVDAATFIDVILPLCNALEQVESVSTVLLDFKIL